MKSDSFIILFLSILASEASKSCLSRVAKCVISMHLIVAALGFCIIKANSPNDLPATNTATSRIVCLVSDSTLFEIGTAVKS